MNNTQFTLALILGILLQKGIVNEQEILKINYLFTDDPDRKLDDEFLSDILLLLED